MNLREYFPEAVVNDEASLGADWLSVGVGNQFVHFPLEQLSLRERALLTLQSPSLETEDLPQTVWYQYLVQKKGSQPQKFEAVQFLYIEHSHRLSSDLLEFFHGLLPNLTAVIEVGASRTVLLLDQAQGMATGAVIQDILPMLEHDFGTKLAIFLGNVWTKPQGEELRSLFESENQLFSDFVRYKGDESTQSFAQMILWGFSRQLDMGIIVEKISQFIEESKDSREIIAAMWESQGNLVQTAQKLFMHRNSLQYKLDKFHSLSGLNLKNLDDLAFCHLLLLNE